MGYTRIVQSGHVLEVYEYEKELHLPDYWQKHVRKIRRHLGGKKRRKTETYKGRDAVRYRSPRSISRAKQSFFRLVQSNLPRTENLAFITLTTHTNIDAVVAYRYLADFWARMRKNIANELTYISVPEWQKKSGNIHFHCLVWGLPSEAIRSEGATRNVQRQWNRGYVDVRPAVNTSPAIAGYMAKYMGKAMEDERLRNIRAYSSSRNIHRPRTSGANALNSYLDSIDGYVDNNLDKTTLYETKWLGRCNYKSYHIKPYESGKQG